MGGCGYLKDAVLCVYLLRVLVFMHTWEWVAGFPGGSEVKNLLAILGSGRSPGGGHGNPLQYSCLENPMDMEGRAWQGTVYGVVQSKESDMAEHTQEWMAWVVMYVGGKCVGRGSIPVAVDVGGVRTIQVLSGQGTTFPPAKQSQIWEHISPPTKFPTLLRKLPCLARIWGFSHWGLWRHIPVVNTEHKPKK